MYSFARETLAALSAKTEEEPPRFDVDSLADLPSPARRFLAHALPPGTPLADSLELEMTGEIALRGRWMPFRARQVLRAGRGFVWEAFVGRKLMRFRGADALGPGGARMDFRLYGVLPVVRASGSDIARSAAGRLAAETVVWMPQALTPQRQARWRGRDDERAIVTIHAAGELIDVEVTVDESGALRELSLQRWDSGMKPPSPRTFGGAMHWDYVLESGVRIAGGGTVGWDWGTAAAAEGQFFRYAITSARPAFPTLALAAKARP
jgi:hypothetical protein